MALNSLAVEWDRFTEMIFCDFKPSPTQINEMRKAFYAGAYTVLVNVKEIGEPHISEDVGCLHLNNLQAEGKAFYEEMMRDYNSRN